MATSCAAVPATSSTAIVRVDLLGFRLLCDGLPMAQLEGRIHEIRQAKRIFLLPASVSSALNTSPPRTGRTDDLYYVPDNRSADLQRHYPVQPYLGAGGMLSFVTLQLGVRGHVEVTEEALIALRSGSDPNFETITADAQRILQKASALADLREWNTPEAHAHARHDPKTGDPLPDGPDLWRGWILEQLGRSQAAAARGKPDQALFWLGYALHAIQDLATQRGMSMPAKSYLQYRTANNPDEDEDNVDHAVRLTEWVLRRSPMLFTPEQWVAMRDWSGATDPPTSLPKRDLTIDEYFEYVRLADAWSNSAQGELRAFQGWCPRRECFALVGTVFEAAEASQ